MTAPTVPFADPARALGGHRDVHPTWRIKRIPVANPPAGSPPGEAAVLVSNGGIGIAAAAGERMHDIFEARCRDLANGGADHAAIDYGEVSVSYRELEERSNKLARFFQACGIVPGERVALLLDRSIDNYAAVLALSKLAATYVPLDASFPADRIGFIAKDAGITHAVTLRKFANRFSEAGLDVISLDEREGELADFSGEAFTLPCPSDCPDPLAYIIYTSGSTGRPKGVPIRQSSIVNFMRIAAKVYGYRESDRVYQGMTIAFDFSVEEIWVPLAVGATLVPAPSEAKLAGEDLADFLTSRNITALACVPTLLATLKAEQPQLRFLLVSGEACPKDVIDPWLVPGRRVVNAYGPTETTVTATWSVMAPDKTITIGGPLPTYSIVVIDPETLAPLEPGEAGEICIAGIGLADDYLNRPEKTEQAFIEDFLELADNPSGRLYRTGDLGRFTPENEIAFLGRIDTQVKIRGYRIELDEIAAVIRAVPGIAHAVANPYEADGATQLVAYYVPEAGDGPKVQPETIDAALRVSLPDYMVPSYYEELAELPLLPSTKVDRNALPPPSGGRYVSKAGRFTEPRNPREAELALLLAEVLKLEQVSVEAHFLDELGADSLTLASYVTAIRKHLGLRRISMRQLYQHPTIAELALVVEEAAKKEAQRGAPAKRKAAVAKPATENASPPFGIAAPAACDAPSAPQPAISSGEAGVTGRATVPAGVAAPIDAASPVSTASVQPPRREPHVASRNAMIATGAAQVATYSIFLFISIWASVIAYEWVVASTGALETYARTVIATSSIFFGTSAVLIAAKWFAVGRFTQEPIPLWSPAYIRFWIARTAIQINPLNLFAGTPIFSMYLRLLGAKVGRDTVLLSPGPVCTDLVSIGDRAVIRHDVLMPAYTARDGYLFPGRIEIGDDTLICEAVVLDINTCVENGAQVGTTSGLLEGQTVPAGAVYQGSPAEPSQTNYNRVPPRAFSGQAKAAYTALQLAGLCLVSMPASILATFLLVSLGIEASGAGYGILQTSAVELALSAGAILLSSFALAGAIILTVPRFLNLFVIPEKPHPLYGVQYELARSITRLSNNRLLNTLFGDSSMIVYWLSLIGYDLRKSTQTGSNFGVDQRHHSPFLCAFGRNTLVSDGLMMLNMETSASSFVMRQVTMPPDTYVGNVVHYPADSTLGPNCLIATKAAIPIDGKTLTDTGILGSPAFEIPRSVARDQRFDHLRKPGVIEGLLWRKLRSNIVTLILFLLRSWALAFIALGLTLGALTAGNAIALGLGGMTTALCLTAAALVFIPAGALFSILCERLTTRFKPLQPLYCSLYDKRFWDHERFWKLNYNGFLTLFNGTPMKPWFLRLQGARVGRGVFDDGAGLTEPSMVSIGDHSMLNFGSNVQCHSLEDGTFKSDRISIGGRCRLGTGAFVHYGTTMHDNSTLEADSFLMKGSVIEAGTRWHGNPARDTVTENEIAIGTGKGAKRW